MLACEGMAVAGHILRCGGYLRGSVIGEKGRSGPGSGYANLAVLGRERFRSATGFGGGGRRYELAVIGLGLGFRVRV